MKIVALNGSLYLFIQTVLNQIIIHHHLSEHARIKQTKNYERTSNTL